MFRKKDQKSVDFAYTLLQHFLLHNVSAVDFQLQHSHLCDHPVLQLDIQVCLHSLLQSGVTLVSVLTAVGTLPIQPLQICAGMRSRLAKILGTALCA